METRKMKNRKRKRKEKIIFLIVLVLFIPIVCLFSHKYVDNNNEKILKASAKMLKKQKPKALVDNVLIKKPYTYEKYKLTESSVSKESLNFWVGKNETFSVPGAPINANETSKYNTFYVGNNTNVIYLTFDEDTNDTQASITLDVLKANGIKATFFLTYSFIKDNPDLVKRMVSEGNICANGINNNIDMPQLASDNPTEFIKQIVNTEQIYKQAVGQDIVKICRFPDGKYSERALDYSNQTGYRTLFWSFAYKDWIKDINTKDDALNTMKKYYHPGAIYLIHDINVANADALDEFIKYMTSIGYSFDVPTNIK